jgi:amino acid adenylation domain-containing protein
MLLESPMIETSASARLSVRRAKAGEPLGRYCHAAIYRVPDGARERLAGNLARAVDEDACALAALGRPVLWVEPVPGPADGELARARREREARRPLAPDAFPAVRLVVLSYSDGASDLVIVAHRGCLDRRSLDLMARMAFTGELAETAPEISFCADRAVLDACLEHLRGAADEPLTGWWDMEREAGSAVQAHAVALPGLKLEERSRADVLAALGVVLARTTSSSRVVLGAVNQEVTGDPTRLGPFEGLAVAALDVDENETVAGFRASVGRLWRDAGHLWHTAELDEAIGPDGLTVPVGLVLAENMTAADYLPSQDLLYPLTVQVGPEDSGELHAVCWHRPAELPSWWVAQFARQLAAACRELLSGPQGRRLGELELLDRSERERIVALGRAIPAPSSPSGLIHRAVEARAQGSPEAVAVTGPGIALTYRELDQRANRLAHALRSHGVEPGHRVGVCLDRSAELIAVLLAIFKAGAAYVPLDPEYPAARLAYVAEDAGLALIVADEHTADSFPGQAVVRSAELSALAAESPADPPAAEVRPNDPAYVIYTSGSTGRPKGVVVPHRNVLALVSGTEADFGFSSRDTWTWFHSVAFDFSVWEIWGCLLTGGRLVIVPHWTCRSPDDFRDLLLAEQVTILNQTPSAFAQLLDVERRRPSGLAVRLVVFGGEPLDAGMLLPWFDLHPESACRLVNMFGITETTVHVTAQTVSRAEGLARSKSVGRPIPGWSVRVLDATHRVLPPGAVGEIAVGGDGLALHYLNRPELTEERFITAADCGERLYLSGDRGRLLPDGRLEHLGRLDNQVKIRGYRIELDEIRAVLLEDPAVITAAVVVHQAEQADAASARLDAYVVLGSSDGAAGAARVRARAAKLLPDYMVPSTVSAVRSLPLTANGKLDASQLPAPPREPGLEPAPAAGLAGAVLTAWRSVLGQEIGPGDNFFDLGGNSLLAVRLIAALRDRGFAKLPVQELYRHPTARELTTYLQRVSTPDDDPTAREAAS